MKLKFTKLSHSRSMLGLFISTFAVISFSNSVMAEKTQPNIIYINTDDWGIGKVPCYEMDEVSQKIIKTPNLDRLRKEGMKFTRAYAGNAVCGPSRCSLMSGKHPGNAAWRANSKEPPVELWPPKHPMLGSVARDAGYATAGFGKLSAGGSEKPKTITGYGFDYWLGFLSHFDCRDYYPHHIYENGQQIELPKNRPDLLEGTIIPSNKNTSGGVVPPGVGTFTENLYADKAIEFIKKNTEIKKPFFIYLASTVPHGGMPGGMRVPDMAGYDKYEELTLREKVYCALMTHHDRNVGRIIDAVEQLGIQNNTIIMWTSDNGDEDSYYLKTDTFKGNGSLRMYKRYLYEGGIRVPLIAWWPGTIEAGSVCDLPTAQYDLMPTLADAGAKAITEEMDGISIMPTLRGEGEKQTKREYLYWEFYERGKQQAVHMGKWKAYRKNGLKGKTELFDLTTDISEEKNLAGKYPEIVKRMEEIMEKEHTTHPRWRLPGIDPELKDVPQKRKRAKKKKKA
ncbi:arylsulfatase [Lentisphaera marina]|uniref:arylsulfatase n=1 Tax=Lentisphaera marina TaxID=1111041 RepID=UPI0023666ACD|nr:arylsulfatase [Lentisphaera marina]MDD7984621.1 arylsulfatase [Lentisphaera marina]